MERATVTLTDATAGPVSPYLFGGLTEHFGYGIYGGLWDVAAGAPHPGVLDLVRRQAPTMLRYPGGCFSDWYHWRDGVGPVEDRPFHDRQFWTDFVFAGAFGPDEARLHGPPEPNLFGTDEFLRYCLDIDAEPLLIANFGTGTPEEAAEWVAYCNRDRLAPRTVRWWGVGNETYGAWELGHCSGAEYGKRFADFAVAMRAVDPDIKLVAVGCIDDEGQHPNWNADVIAAAGEHIDALSVHWYFPGPWIGRGLRDDEDDFRLVATGADELGVHLDRMVAQLDEYDPDRRITLSLDEWNIWVEWRDLLHVNHRLCDSVFIAGCLNRMLERAGRVEIAMISHLVNCMAPIQTDGDRAFGTASHLTQVLYREAVRGESRPVTVECGEYEVAPFADAAPVPLELTQAAGVHARSAPVLDAAATADAGGVSVFLANRLLDGPQEVTVTGLPAGATGRFRWVDGPGPWARNTAERPSELTLAESAAASDPDGRCTVSVPAHTVGVLTLQT